MFIVERAFGALRVPSEHNIVATFDAITSVLLNISRQPDKLLRHLNPLHSPALSEQKQHNVPEDTLLDSTVD